MPESLAPKGLLVAAPSSGCGKTVLTLALLRALESAGYSIAGAKAGPDYIDPAFHALAAGSEAFNLDPWAMDRDSLWELALGTDAQFLLVEGMMGLFDGAADGTGSAADLSQILGLPVLLVVDAAKQSHSIAALVRGFRDHRPDLMIGGLLLNKVGSERHEALLRDALERIDMPVLGAIRRNDALHLPERHLGLIQAGETSGIEAFITKAAESVAAQCNLEAIAALFRPMHGRGQTTATSLSLLPRSFGQHIAIARDQAFSFVYPHLLKGLRDEGREVSFFSPLRDEMPDERADSIYLPGGYPELHCAGLAAAENFRSAMMKALQRGTFVYGECGGYMVLGRSIIDREGHGHPMLNLLALETSFEKRKLHLGYRRIKGLAAGFSGLNYTGHEFHYTTALTEDGDALFEAADASGNDLGKCGLCRGNVMGSYLHLVAAKDGQGDLR